MLRPAFLKRFFSRSPDFLGLRTLIVGSLGLVAGVFGVLLVLALAQLDARRCADVARERATTMARTAGMWLDGDAHAGLGQDAEKRLSDVRATLAKLLEATGDGCVVRTLRPNAVAKPALAADPARARNESLEVVLDSSSTGRHPDLPYDPRMRDALFEGKTVAIAAGSSVNAYAPILDAWGSTPALVWVQAPASAPLWRRIVFPVACSVLAALLVAGVVWFGRRLSASLELQVARLESTARALAAGQLPSPLQLGAGAPRELSNLAEALDGLRARVEAQVTGQPIPVAQPSAEEEQRQSSLGEASDFDLVLLLQQLVEPAQKSARARAVDMQLFLPDGVSKQLSGYPMPLFRALDGLLRNALRVTKQGRITLRVTRAGDGVDGGKLRFEISDTGPGIAFKEQQDLASSLQQAAQADPASLKNPLEVASAFAAALGGELAFESQPGQGSRFGFTTFFGGLPPTPPGVGTGTAFQQRPPTGFHQRAANAPQPRPAPAPQPRPVTGLQQRPATAFQQRPVAAPQPLATPPPQAAPQQRPPRPPPPPPPPPGMRRPIALR